MTRHSPQQEQSKRVGTGLNKLTGETVFRLSLQWNHGVRRQGTGDSSYVQKPLCGGTELAWMGVNDNDSS